jgi:hypothetical protein
MSRLRSTILGSELVIETPNDPTSFGVVESLLGALEAFLATSDEADLLPHRERTIMVVSASDQLVGVPEIRFCNDDSSRVEIVHPADLMFPSAKDIRNFVDWLKDSVVAVLSRLFIIRDIEPWMDRIAGQERSFSRALMLGDALTLDRNVFGDKPKPRLADWLEPEDKVYQRLRDRPWRAAKPSAPAAAGRSSAPPKPGSGPPPLICSIGVGSSIPSDASYRP